MTSSIKKLIGLRNRAFHLDPALCKKVRNIVINEIKVTKAIFYPNKIHHLKQSNNRRQYSKIKTYVV